MLWSFWLALASTGSMSCVVVNEAKSQPHFSGCEYFWALQQIFRHSFLLKRFIFCDWKLQEHKCGNKVIQTKLQTMTSFTCMFRRFHVKESARSGDGGPPAGEGACFHPALWLVVVRGMSWAKFSSPVKIGSPASGARIAVREADLAVGPVPRLSGRFLDKTAQIIMSNFQCKRQLTKL